MQLNKYLVCLLLLLLSALVTHAQDKVSADRLIQILQEKKIDDSTRFELLKKVAFNHPDPGKSLQYAQEAFVLAEKLEDPLRKGRALEEVSLSQRALGNHKEAVAASLSALQIYEKFKLNKRLAGMQLMIGTNHLVDKNFRLALRHLLQAEKIYDSIDAPNPLINVHINLGEAYRLMQRLDSAEYYTASALTMATEIDNQLSRGYALGNLGMINVARGKASAATAQLTEAIGILNSFGDHYSVSIYQSELGNLAFSQGQYKQAEEKYLEAYRLANAFNLKEQLRDFSALLVRLHEKTGNHTQALFYQKSYQTYQDSLVNVENIRAISQLTANYELDKRQQQIALLHENARISTYRTYALIACLALFLLLIAVLYTTSKRRKKTNLILERQKKQIEYREKEKELFLNELNHRTKNNLQTISSIISLQSRQLVGHPSYDLITEGKSRIDALSLIHQKLYQDSFRMKIQIKDYLTELLQNLVYGYNKNTEVSTNIIDLEMDVDRAVPLALIVNELVTNSMKYAFDTVKTPRLTATLQEQDNHQLVLEVADNGPGFGHKDFENATSFGHKLVRSLASQLQGEITYFDNNPGCGWKLNFHGNARH